MNEARIMRVWRGWTSKDDAAAYEDYMRATGFAEYRATDGNQGVYMTRRDDGGTTEFCLISFWASWDAVRAFAGDEPSRAVFYPDDDRFLVDRELTVSHYDVFEAG